MNDKNKDNLVYVRHILDAIKAIKFYTEGMDFKEFKKDQKTVDAIVRQFEIIGEATRHITTAYRECHTQVAWQKMVSMRNFLAHEYLRIDLDIIWDTVKKQLPELKKLLTPLLKEKK